MAEEMKQEESKAENPQQNTGSDVKGMLAQFESMLDEYMVKKAPFQIPVNGKEFIVKVSPYLVIIGAVLFLPALLGLLGLTAVFSPFSMMGGYMMGAYWGWYAKISLITSIAVFALEIMAIPGLFKRTKGAWRLIFYATLVSLLGSVLAGNILGGAVSAIIGWYILFQVKELYKN